MRIAAVWSPDFSRKRDRLKAELLTQRTPPARLSLTKSGHTLVFPRLNFRAADVNLAP